MNKFEEQYLAIMRDILDNGFDHADRTGTGRRSITSRMIKIDLREGFPLVTTQKVFTRGCFEELRWMIAGGDNVEDLRKVNVNFWNAWAVSNESVDIALEKPELARKIADGIGEYSSNIDLVDLKKKLLSFFEGSIGKLYGPAWRKAPGEVDQLMNLLQSINDDRYGSRHVMTSLIPEWLSLRGYTPEENVMLGRGALFPCHGIHLQYQVQPGVGGKDILHSTVTMRSQDYAVGTIINIPFYALLQELIAKRFNMVAGEMTYVGVDIHIYKDQLAMAREQVKRIPKALPKLTILGDKGLFDFNLDDIKIDGYEHHPHIPYPVSK